MSRLMFGLVKASWDALGPVKQFPTLVVIIPASQLGGDEGWWWGRRHGGVGQPSHCHLQNCIRLSPLTLPHSLPPPQMTLASKQVTNDVALDTAP